MANRSPFLRKVIALTAATVARIGRRTIDWKIQYFDPRVDPVHPECVGRRVFATWHENVLVPAVMRGSKQMVALASLHGDGDIISRAMNHLNWGTIRGSSTRGGTTAMIKMLRDHDRNLSIAPDGPRGPRRVMSMGVIFLAAKIGYPLVCFGSGFDRPWRARSWDRFAVPRPFSRARAIMGPPITIPNGLRSEAMEEYRQWFEDLLNHLSDESEKWADSGQSRPGEFQMIPGRFTPEVMDWKPSDAPQLPENLRERLKALQETHASSARFPRLATPECGKRKAA